MNKTMNDSDSNIQTRVIRSVADCLALDADDMNVNARLIDDLGADSLDFIDILFAIEQDFRVKLRSADVEAFLRADFSEANLVDGRYLDATAYQRLLQWLPRLQQAPDPTRVTPAQVFSFITVETFVLIVQSALKR
jgi:acyl carrier protein